MQHPHPDESGKKRGKLTAALTILAVAAAAVIIPVALKPELLSRGGASGSALLETEAVESIAPDAAGAGEKTRYDLIMERIENEKSNPEAAYEFEARQSGGTAAPAPVSEEEGLVEDATGVEDGAAAPAGEAVSDGGSSLTQQAYNPGDVHMTTPYISTPTSGTGELVNDITLDINGNEVTAKETAPPGQASSQGVGGDEDAAEESVSEEAPIIEMEEQSQAEQAAPDPAPAEDYVEYVEVPTDESIGEENSGEAAVEAITEEVLARLMQLGYSPYYSLTESYDPSLAQLGIVYFQRNNGLPITGLIDEDTFYSIMDEAAPLYSLLPGMEGEDVRQIQDMINALGYTLSATGKFDAETEAAVIALKQNNGLDPTASIDAALRDALIAATSPNAVEQQVQEGE